MLSIAMQFSLRNVNYLTSQEPNKTSRTNSMAILVFSYKDKAKTKRKDHFPTIKYLYHFEKFATKSCNINYGQT